MRVILYTGKGCVGKTTVSAATALRAAELGYRTLVLSTDPTHSLQDSFEKTLGPEPVPIMKNLWGQEVNVLEELNNYWGEVQSYYGYHTDAIVANRLLPEDLQHPYLAEWHAAQKRHREAIGYAFAPLPVLEAPFFDAEVVGISRLREMARELFGEADPTKFFHKGTIQTVEKKGGDYFLTLDLPFVKKGDVSLIKHGEELAISIANFRRDLVLPRTVATMEIQKASLQDGQLVIQFKGKPGEPSRKKR